MQGAKTAPEQSSDERAGAAANTQEKADDRADDLHVQPVHANEEGCSPLRRAVTDEAPERARHRKMHEGPAPGEKAEYFGHGRRDRALRIPQIVQAANRLVHGEDKK